MLSTFTFDKLSVIAMTTYAASIATAICLLVYVTMATYTDILESEWLPGDEKKIPLTIMGLYPVKGTSWPAG